MMRYKARVERRNKLSQSRCW